MFSIGKSMATERDEAEEGLRVHPPAASSHDWRESGPSHCARDPGATRPLGGAWEASGADAE